MAARQSDALHIEFIINSIACWFGLSPTFFVSGSKLKPNSPHSDVLSYGRYLGVLAAVFGGYLVAALASVTLTMWLH